MYRSKIYRKLSYIYLIGRRVIYMQIMLIKKDSIHSHVLPEKQRGQYWISQINDDGEEEKVIGIEGIEGKWILKSNKNAFIQDKNNRRIKEIEVEELSFYNIFLKKTNERVILYSEPITFDRKTFEKLILPKEGRVIIGRSRECDICFLNSFTSSKHAEIVVSGDEIKIRNLNSTNGSFVNGTRLKERSLKPGDIIYILGLKIIVSRGFIAINNPDGKMIYNKNILKSYEKEQPEVFDDEQCADDEITLNTFFYRSPRFKRDIEKKKIKVDPPPQMDRMDETPIMLMLGPSLTMGLGSLVMAGVTIQNVLRTNGDMMMAMPTLAMSFSMLLGTVLWPILTKRYEKKRRKKREALRQERYREYLEGVKQDIIRECDYQSEILKENHVTLDECINRIKLRQRNLWERAIGQNDFLKIRLGVGNLPLEADIKYPEKRFSIDDDNLQDELYKLVDEPKILRQVPITLSLTDNFVSGIIGARSSVIELVKGIIVQLVSLHSYDELKLVFIYDKKESEIWEFVKWLPHVWGRGRDIRFIATNSNEVKELSAFLDRELAKREGLEAQGSYDEFSPYYVIFAMSKELSGKSEAVSSILKHKKNHGFSLITLYDELNNLPKEASMVVELYSSTSKIYDKNDITGQHITFQPDVYLREDMEEIAVCLANTSLDSSEESYSLPNMLTFLEMFGVGKIEHLNALTRWRDNDPTIALETPIGVDASGEIFKLDLHEKFHGPHGLIAGMTGSGKSEFIMTFILSLAVNYHPDEVAFILIDYKGGGMASAFTSLPHLAGTITNLDGAAVKRSLVSIQSELKRRQAIFSETSKKINISNIDIYKYQKLYRDGAVEEPLQHLFIISDEFAELKTQQPEFMEQLVSAARIGRSLGVHLILATQKPSGVVDDQIWSNSRFRICLKVQEKADSMDVIKRPDAAELSTTGRYFVQVGFNELFELGQSAWSAAPYYPAERIEREKDESITIIDNLGRVIKQVKLDKRRQIFKNPPKQIDEITKYLEKLANEENIRVRPLWLEPIPELIYIDELREKYRVQEEAKNILNPVIGEIDDPENQKQHIMRVPITREGNSVIYGAAGSGKTTFLTTLIYSLISEHTPREINLYILDFSSETLRAFSKAPHVGEVLLSHESEKINNLFKMLVKEIEKRKKLFSDYGGDYEAYIRNSGKEMESILVIIHNYSAFNEAYEEKEESIAYLTREGVKYGIYFIVTALNTGAVRYRILQNFKQLFVLQLNDQSDYSGVLGNVDGVYPSKYKGRGIFRRDRVFEFQTAHISKSAANTFDYIRSFCGNYANSWGEAPAKRVPILPNKVDINYLASEISFSPDESIPVGIEKSSLKTSYYSFESSYITLVMSQSNENADFIQGLSEAMAFRKDSRVIAIDVEEMFGDDDQRDYEYITSGLNEMIQSLFNTLVYRNNTYKDARSNGEEPPSFEKITCVINSLSQLIPKLSEDSKDKLRVFLEKGEVEYNINFIISDTPDGIAQLSYESWFKSKVSLNDGIWIGNGITDQYQFKITKITSDLYDEIGDSFGYMLRKGKTRLVKLLSSVTSNLEGEIDG